MPKQSMHTEYAHRERILSTGLFWKFGVFGRKSAKRYEYLVLQL